MWRKQTITRAGVRVSFAKQGVTEKSAQIGEAIRQMQSKKYGNCESVPPQRHYDFLVSSLQNDAAILDALDRDLVNLISHLQTELLAFSHGFAIDDGKMRARIEGDGSH